ncbi:MAG: hypothetical protein NTX25_04105 [Proteobacteria bacterium]|nr:hypothetical protein [Pseudomonadota bacterium]
MVNIRFGFAFLLLAAAGLSSCKTGGRSDLNAADTADKTIYATPFFEGKGFPDTCAGCLAHWAAIEDINKTHDAAFDWNVLQRKCRQKGQCAAFDYVNAWSVPLFLSRVVKGPPAQWSEWRKSGKKVACFFSDAYFTGDEVCYEAPAKIKLPANMAGKVSSYSVTNIKELAVGWPVEGGMDFKTFKFDDGFNLLPEFNDKITVVTLPAN